MKLAYVAYARRDVGDEELRRWFRPDFRFHTRPDWPGRGIYAQDEMPELWAELDDTFTEYALEPVRFIDAPPGFELVELRSGATLRGGTERLVEAIFHLWRFEGDLIAEAWTFRSVEQALVAAGRA